MNKKDAQAEFDKLDTQQKQVVIGTLKKARQGYLMSGQLVDMPYFFWSINPALFAGIDPAEFLEITESYEFGVQAVYYISKYINERQQQGAKA